MHQISLDAVAGEDCQTTSSPNTNLEQDQSESSRPRSQRRPKKAAALSPKSLRDLWVHDTSVPYLSFTLILPELPGVTARVDWDPDWGVCSTNSFRWSVEEDEAERAIRGVEFAREMRRAINTAKSAAEKVVFVKLTGHAKAALARRLPIEAEARRNPWGAGR